MAQGLIFLAGGGDERQSFAIDAAFSSATGSAAPILYVPHAKPQGTHSAALDWLRQALGPHGLSKFVLWDEAAPLAALDEASGVYIGGGSTKRLSDLIERGPLRAMIRAAAESGIPLYGGSAGAIILGRDLWTSNERDVTRSDKGMNLLSESSVYCHLREGDHAQLAEMSIELGAPLVALAESSGVVVSDGTMTPVGGGSVLLASQGFAVQVAGPTMMSAPEPE